MLLRTIAVLGLLLMIPLASIAGDGMLTDEWRAAYGGQIDSAWALGVIDDIDTALAEIAGLTETLVADGELSEDGADKLLGLVAKVGKDIVEERFGTPEERSERPELSPFNGVSKGNSSYDSEYREQTRTRPSSITAGTTADGMKEYKSTVYMVTGDGDEKTMEVVVGSDGVVTVNGETIEIAEPGITRHIYLEEYAHTPAEGKEITILSDDGKVYITGDGVDEEIDIDAIVESAGKGVYHIGEGNWHHSVDELLDLQGGITHLEDIHLELKGLRELKELGELKELEELEELHKLHGFAELEELEDFQDIHAQVLKEIEGLKVLDELKVLKEIQTSEEYLPGTLETELKGIEAELVGFEAELDALLKEIEELLRGFVEETKSV